MNKRLILAIFSFVAIEASVRAQSAAGPKLSEPILRRAPANAEWTVRFFGDRSKVQEAFSKQAAVAEDGDVPEGAQSPKSVTISKAKDVYREVTTWPAGKTTEKWVTGDLQLYEEPASGKIARAVIPSSYQFSETYSDYRRSDFEELEWIGKDNFKGVKEVGGIQVFAFQADSARRRLTPREISGLEDPDKSHETPANRPRVDSEGKVYTAYLDVRTQLPLYFDDGQTVRLYTFADQPPGSLILPARFNVELATWKKELNRRRPLPRP